MPAPSTQPETEALLEKSVEEMLAQTTQGAPGAGAIDGGAAVPDSGMSEPDAGDTPAVEGDMLAPEELPGVASDPVATALESVAKDLDDLKREADHALPRAHAAGVEETLSVPTGPAPREEASADAAPAIASIEELDRALAEIAQEQLGDEEDAAPKEAEAEKVRAVLEQAAVIEPEAVPLATAGATDPAAGAQAEGSEAEPPAGEFAAPEIAQPEPEPVLAVAPAEAATAPAPVPTKAAPVAPTAPAPKPEAAAREVRPAPAPVQAEPVPAAAKPRRPGVVGLIAAFFSLINEPFRDLSPGARDTLSLIAIITMFNALCLWAFIFLR